MSTVTELAMRQEVATIARRRPDVIRPNPSTCPPHAALLHKIAALITTEDLPPAHVSVKGQDIIVDCSGSGLVQGDVRRWAAALGMVVTEVAYDCPDGTAATLWSASGWDGTGCWWHVAGALPVPVPA